mgnify:CR=1
MAKGQVMAYPYRDINRRVLGKALVAQFGGTWRVGTTNDESTQEVHIQRLDRPVRRADTATIQQLLLGHVYNPDLR